MLKGKKIVLGITGSIAAGVRRVIPEVSWALTETFPERSSTAAAIATAAA